MEAAPHPVPAFSGVIVPVILAGGSGSRLWPLSREQHPKQFLALTSGRSLLQDTLLRASRIEHAAPPLIIGSEAHRFLIAEQLRETGIEGAHIALEPEGRNTAPAVAVAAHHVAAVYGREALAFIMSADHAISDEARFLDAVQAGAAAAALGRIVVFGIKPTRPETGFGYLEIDEPLDTSGQLLHVAAFVEKPELARAQQFVNGGRHYWNAGLFLFRVDRFLSELRRLEPELHEHAHLALVGAARDNGFIHIEPTAFHHCRSDSVDYAVMEKSPDLVAVPLDAGWDDVGCWSYMGNLPASDADDNRIRGDVVLHNSQRNLVHAAARMVALVDVNDHIVVETADALLVTPRTNAQNVKQLVQKLHQEGRPQVSTHPKVRRPWGSYETIALGERFQVKRIVVNPEQKLSLQMHHHRAEHWVVVKGTARVICGEQDFLLTENQSTYIPLGQKHRLENPGIVPLEIIEVQSGAYLGEDDIVRFDDQYGRVAPAPEPAPEPASQAAPEEPALAD